MLLNQVLFNQLLPYNLKKGVFLGYCFRLEFILQPQQIYQFQDLKKELDASISIWCDLTLAKTQSQRLLNEMGNFLTIIFLKSVATTAADTRDSDMEACLITKN